jgi:23S rRNA (uracil1939-C5)-methyltransferase
LQADNPLIIKLTVDNPAYGGLTVGRIEGKAALVKGAIAGETVEAEIIEEKKDYCMAVARKILTPSPYRKTPKCRFFGVCGGCRLQHISYEGQLETKQAVLAGSLKRIGKIETPLSQPLFINNPWNYRFRAQFKISGDKIGFYRENSNDIVDIDSCPLMAPRINETLSKARPIIERINGAKELHISTGDRVSALLKISETGKCERHDIEDLLKFAGLSGIIVSFGKKTMRQYGNTRLELELCGLKYTISPKSFFQSHWILNLKVIEFIKNELAPLSGKTILDLYCGAGNFSLPLAAEAEKIIAVEENPAAIQDGKLNLKTNGISNYEFIYSCAEKLSIKDNIDILITDPPRAGLTNKAIEKIFNLHPVKIVYISCNPATLARDLKKLLTGYEIESIRMIDFFPQTYHIESLVFLTRKMQFSI